MGTDLGHGGSDLLSSPFEQRSYDLTESTDARDERPTTCFEAFGPVWADCV